MEQKPKSEQNQKNNKIKPYITYGIIAAYFVFVACSYLTGQEMGIAISKNFEMFARDMFTLFPPAFVLVGLFMVWVDRKIIEKHFGEASGWRGYLMAILLACTTLYPFVVVLPMASGLAKKGARLSVLMTYLGATAICRIPMSIFEASFLGVRFTIIRYAVSLPLIVLSSIAVENLMGKSYLSTVITNKDELESNT